MPGEDIDSILAELSSHKVENAWKAFLRSYGKIIMQVARQYENDKDRADECFLYVCEKLSDDGFRRLLQFDSSRAVSFRTWLHSVVSNLCIDWYRNVFGRARPYRVIAAAPAFDRLVYQYKFEWCMSLETCFRALQPAYPDLTRNQLARTISRIHTMLTPRQRWQLSFRKRETASIADTDSVSGNSTSVELIDPGPGPDAIAQLQQDRQALLEAMSCLTYQQRLLLRLRYQQDLPLKEVARLAGLNDLFQTRRRINSALAMLAELMTPPPP